MDYSSSPAGRVTRRQMLRLASWGALAGSASGWIENLAAKAATDPRRRKACILLWMSGGPSQIDTFDPKPGHENGGPFKPISTSVPGMQIGEHLPRLAREANELAIIRGMSTKEGDHSRATYVLRTGYLPQGSVRYPALGSLISKELEDDSAELPGFVSVAPYRAISPGAFGSGFLGPRYAPLVVGERSYGAGKAGSRAFHVDDLELPPDVPRDRADDRLKLLQSFARDFRETRPGVSPESHNDAYTRAVRMMRSPAAKAFELDEEPAALRDAYGRNPFGQGCLLARRLVERGVPFVEVTLSSVDGRNSLGWDTHAQNFDAVKGLCGVLDAGWSTLISDLRSRGRLDDTLIVWMGEFGRTPKINESAGRDHFPNAWSTVLSGGKIHGGRVIGDTGADGMEVRDRPVAVPDLLATIVKALGLDPMTQNTAEDGRPIRLVDPKAKPIAELLG
ncbi:hypothetical protein OJF2_26450 [Aquisphaera giovannonii]|uniref:Sulfatase n=1 Tax=Aquisphaera giovannonii TaxID=406548 RepID=A0A5B9W1N9_9BACT|nr:DUF1501 domain-containing protein [Aquisphaera giovannonii]QEH34111.1 hypothetical protein OJF2_26450 [Aquisphaera giovannonii]